MNVFPQVFRRQKSHFASCPILDSCISLPIKTNNEFKFGRLLYREIAGFCPFKNRIHVVGGPAEQVIVIQAVGHQATLVYEFLLEVNLTFPLQDCKSTFVKYLSLILALTLAACGVPEMVKPGTSEQESAKDRFECLRASESTSSWSLFGLGTSQATHNQDVYRSCMEARGYVVQ